jgi:hypothetical protein
MVDERFSPCMRTLLGPNRSASSLLFLGALNETVLLALE